MVAGIICTVSEKLSSPSTDVTRIISTGRAQTQTGASDSFTTLALYKFIYSLTCLLADASIDKFKVFIWPIFVPFSYKIEDFVFFANDANFRDFICF